MKINTILTFAIAMMASTANAYPLDDFPEGSYVRVQGQNAIYKVEKNGASHVMSSANYLKQGKACTEPKESTQAQLDLLMSNISCGKGTTLNKTSFECESETVVVDPAVAAKPTVTASNCWIAGFCHAHGKDMLGGGLDKKACATQYEDQWRTGDQLPQMVGLIEQSMFSLSVEVLCDWRS